MLSNKISDNMALVRQIYGQSPDLYMKRLTLSGIPCCAVLVEGLASLEKLWELLLEPIVRKEERFSDGKELFVRLLRQSGLPVQPTPVKTEEAVEEKLSGGFALLFIEGCPAALALATQSKTARSVGEPSGEGNIRGSKEGFTESLQANLALLRRRLRGGGLFAVTLSIGSVTKTDVALLYLTEKADKKVCAEVERRLRSIQVDKVLEAGYLAPFLKAGQPSFFSAVGYTERPDTLAAKLCEGKVAVVVDGSPFVMVLPYFFTEHFSTMDDYAQRPYFASFMRLLKYAAFIAAVFLPGFFVAALEYAPQYLPRSLLLQAARDALKTPLPPFAEALFILFVLEVVREAGLRLPSPIGHSVGLVAALIVGDAAVETELLTAPMLIALALSAISTFVVPSLYEEVTVLRMVFVLLGGFFGPAGLAAGAFALLVNMTAVDAFAMPYTMPLSPAAPGALTDGLLRTKPPGESKIGGNVP